MDHWTSKRTRRLCGRIVKMMIKLFDFPLPNNGERYDLSQNELVELLNNAYNCGFEHARDAYDSSRQGIVTWASSEDIDDNTR